MNLAFQKTLGLLLLILIGLVLQKKISSSENLKGIKVLILSVALPATIFVALLKLELESSLLILPLLALAFNFLLLGISNFSLNVFGLKKSPAIKRTLMMLIPSLAPGLSCLPFIAEYLGESELAMAALADVGNKVFVLILLYILAMQWYHKSTSHDQKTSTSGKVKGLLLSMINEPINMVIILALVLLGLGYNLSSFPPFMEATILRISAMMAPLVLLFIGLAVKIKWKEFNLIFRLLVWRAGVTFLISGTLIFLVPSITPALALLAIVFPQSSCSFWPFAHMTAVDNMEKKNNAMRKTFNTDFAVSVLACSLPFSTILILTVFSLPEFFIQPLYVGISGILCICISFLSGAARKLLNRKTDEEPSSLDFSLTGQHDKESESKKAS